MKILNFIYDILWPRWNSMRDIFDTLTCSSWSLSDDALLQWINSNQGGQLKPESRSGLRLTLLRVWLAVNLFRFVTYMALLPYYPANIVNGQLIKPRFPYYFGDMMQLSSNFLLYSYSASIGALMFAYISSTHFCLNRYAGNRSKYLRWYRFFVYIEVMLTLNVFKAQKYFILFRHISPERYERYQHNFRRALRAHTIILRINNFLILLNFISVIRKVIQHPEWEYPLATSILFELIYQISYYFLFKISYTIQLVFYINSTFVTMLLESVIDQLESGSDKKRAKLVISYFANTFHLMVDLHRFWSSNMGYYYLILIPTVMPFIYLFFFVPLNLAYKIRILYIIILYSLSLHFTNWTAAKVSLTSQKIYKKLYFRKVLTQNNIHTRIKLCNILDIISSKSIPFGFKLGTLGMARRRTSIFIFVTMIRVLLYATKMARQMH